MTDSTMAHLSKIMFKETHDPFPDEDVFDKDDSCLDQKYKELSNDLFGETAEKTVTLINNFKEATKKSGIDIPGCKFR